VRVTAFTAVICMLSNILAACSMIDVIKGNHGPWVCFLAQVLLSLSVCLFFVNAAILYDEVAK
jgi:hypothetical protein